MLIQAGSVEAALRIQNASGCYNLHWIVGIQRCCLPGLREHPDLLRVSFKPSIAPAKRCPCSHAADNHAVDASTWKRACMSHGIQQSQQ